MQVFLYEFITGGGLLDRTDPAPLPSLLAEATTMLTAMATDLGLVVGRRVVLLRNRQLDRCWWPVAPGIHTVEVTSAADHEVAFARAVAESDYTLLVAPELDGHLTTCCRRVGELGGRLLSPGLEVVRLAADKQATVQRLAAAGIPVPEGRPLAPGEPPPDDFPYPAVFKPTHGAGSQQIHLLHEPPRQDSSAPRLDCPGRLERLCPGQAASVALLCGPAGCVPLPPCRQHVSPDEDFAYQGGSLPLPPSLADRATRLAQAAVATLPEPIGYLGVDLVLGPNPDGSEDVVIEINPRLTTSYVGLRAVARTNLAEAMCRVAAGQLPELSFRPLRIEFDPDGTIRETALPG